MRPAVKIIALMIRNALAIPVNYLRCPFMPLKALPVPILSVCFFNYKGLWVLLFSGLVLWKWVDKTIIS